MRGAIVGGILGAILGTIISGGAADGTILGFDRFTTDSSEDREDDEASVPNFSDVLAIRRIRVVNGLVTIGLASRRRCPSQRSYWAPSPSWGSLWMRSSPQARRQRSASSL